MKELLNKLESISDKANSLVESNEKALEELHTKLSNSKTKKTKAETEKQKATEECNIENFTKAETEISKAETEIRMYQSAIEAFQNKMIASDEEVDTLRTEAKTIIDQVNDMAKDKIGSLLPDLEDMLITLDENIKVYDSIMNCITYKIEKDKKAYRAKGEFRNYEIREGISNCIESIKIALKEG